MKHRSILILFLTVVLCVIAIIAINANGAAFQAVCSCGWKGSKFSANDPQAVMKAQQQGNEHARRVGNHPTWVISVRQ